MTIDGITRKIKKQILVRSHLKLTIIEFIYKILISQGRHDMLKSGGDENHF